MVLKQERKVNVKYLAALLLFLTAIPGWAADTSDLDPGIDPTGFSTITAAQLLQLVQQATIKNNNAITNGKGIIWRSTMPPDVAADPRKTNWLFLDLSAGIPGILRQYVSGSWMAAPVGTVYSTNLSPGSVTQVALATNAVDTINIINNAVTSAKIAAGAVLNSQLGAGVVSNLNIADITIQSGKIAYNTILATNIADGAITGPKLAAGTITGTQLANYSIDNTKLATNAVGRSNIIAGAVGSEALTNNCVATNNITFTGATALQVLQVDPTASFVGWRTPILSTSATLNMGNMSSVSTAGGATNAHGLLGVPIVVHVVITNNTPEFGYNIGDEVPVGQNDDGTSLLTVAADASNVYVSVTVNIMAVSSRAAGHARQAITKANWGIKAYVFK